MATKAQGSFPRVPTPCMMSPAAFKTQGEADRRDREPFRTPVLSAPDPRVGPSGDGIRGEAVPAVGLSGPCLPAHAFRPMPSGTYAFRPLRWSRAVPARRDGGPAPLDAERRSGRLAPL
ncbi:hypothetical protein GCM10010517_06900 [Streptosporangium fragile]|uniref:Uncharacterized protein n=1 Tax=Streptosporangium fragile TaxID=46186 RepID=A0ABN3VRL3_9ACTN